MERTASSAAKSQRPDFNYQMSILSVIGIVFVMLGHIYNNLPSIGTFYGWFPYYSFHMPLFVFISGYFFKDPSGSGFARSFGMFIWKKVRSLLIPFYVINGCFLVLQTIMQKSPGTWGAVFSLREWLLQPWITVGPYTFAHPSWFMIALFLSEIFFVLLRKLAGLIFRNNFLKELILTVFTGLLTMFIIFCSNQFQIPDIAVVYLRSLLLMFFLQAGHFYRLYLEKRCDAVPSLLWFCIIFVIQLTVLFFTRSNELYFSYVQMVFFGISCFIPIITALTGIALWLRVSKILSQIPKRSRFILFIGDNTKYIMAFHLFGYFIMNCIFYLLLKLPGTQAFIPGFDTESFISQIYYICDFNLRNLLLYFIAGLAFSLGMAKLIEFCRKGISRRLHNS